VPSVFPDNPTIIVFQYIQLLQVIPYDELFVAEITALAAEFLPILGAL
jgi:hypothetical protein